MECSWCLFLGSCLLLVIASSPLRRRFKNGTHQLPPGPPGWPIVGNMFDLGTVPHQTLYELRFKYGPVLWLKLGSVNTITVQSARAAAELFKNHDQAFSDRMCPHVATAHDYKSGSLAFGQPGPYLRAMRRLCHEEVKRVTKTAALVKKCVDDMVKAIEEEAVAAGEVELARFVFVMAFNVIGVFTLSEQVLDSSSGEGLELQKAINKVVELEGTPNVADHLPWLQRLDPQGLKKKMARDLGQAFNIVAGYVKERIEEKPKLGKETKKDFLEAVLECQADPKDGDVKISDHNLIIAVMEMFIAGSDTTSSTLEWAMTELLRNPNAMRKTKQELDQVIGQQSKVEESDIAQLPYLQAVIKEVLRLHPPTPLLLPRKTLEDTNFMGYTIPKHTQVFINAWAIGRDPDVWDDPLLFKPERFLGSNIDYKGQSYELIPFGSGRRICIGMALAHKVLHLALASLLHSFEWELGGDLSPETIDMRDRLGLAVRKLVPLRTIPKSRIGFKV